jgi:hypothetical protein
VNEKERLTQAVQLEKTKNSNSPALIKLNQQLSLSEKELENSTRLLETSQADFELSDNKVQDTQLPYILDVFLFFFAFFVCFVFFCFVSLFLLVLNLWFIILRYYLK